MIAALFHPIDADGAFRRDLRTAVDQAATATGSASVR